MARITPVNSARAIVMVPVVGRGAASSKCDRVGNTHEYAAAAGVYIGCGIGGKKLPSVKHIIHVAGDGKLGGTAGGIGWGSARVRTGGSGGAFCGRCNMVVCTANAV